MRMRAVVVGLVLSHIPPARGDAVDHSEKVVGSGVSLNGDFFYATPSPLLTNLAKRTI
jgi:hypothetical protein